MLWTFTQKAISCSNIDCVIVFINDFVIDFMNDFVIDFMNGFVIDFIIPVDGRGSLYIHVSVWEKDQSRLQKSKAGNRTLPPTTGNSSSQLVRLSITTHPAGPKIICGAGPYKI